jgi:DNA-binding NtrC family response regulator
LPPLRQRREDIPLLAEHFLNAFTDDHVAKRISAKLLELFCKYEWPGNIRELRNVINYASAIDEDGIIDINDLPSALLMSNFFREQGAAFGSGEYIPTDASKRTIENALQSVDFNRTKAAKLLGVSRETLYNKMREYGLSVKYHF